ncbi:hypothetical protein ACFFMN_23220 [Planobispora siamensis]|uniref:Uncharacterized protein n=1 Tax=Planobispora siamensis TaxID=936338 RepID=A0A8J3SJ08_9ACTN|nr:hypothetical protein [Planobispora siamensis]GIH95273.1 hypothetical protein Psi01_59030 [Planobispora siamensis]
MTIADLLPPPPSLTTVLVTAALGVAAHQMPWPLLALVAATAASLAWSAWIAHRLPAARRDHHHITDLALRSEQDTPAAVNWPTVRAALHARHPSAIIDFRQTCTGESHDAWCQGTASTWAGGDRIAVITCGRASAADVAYTLAHEVAHLTGGRWVATLTAGALFSAAGPLIGFATAAVLGWQAIGAVFYVAYLLYIATFWAIEIACDLTAQRQLGRPAATRHWAGMQRAQRDQPLRQRINATLFLLTEGTHPPDSLRLLAARVVGAR